MNKVWLLVLSLGALAVVTGAASAYVYSWPWGMMGWSCTGCPANGGMMMGPMHHGWGGYGPYPYGSGSYEDSSLTPDVEFTLATSFENGRFFFKGNNGEANPTLVVKAGQVVKITLVNSDGITHNIAIPELGVYSSTVSSRGESTSIVFKAPASGEYNYFCTIPGHREAGMIGKLVIVQ